MTKILAQHGAAKGKKIDIALSNEYLSGVVFSPREEKFYSIKEYINSNLLLNKDNTYLDPQLYYSTFEGKIFKNLDYDLCYPQNISRRDWRKKTPALMDYINKHAENSALISNHLITPGFYIQDLDWKFDYSLDIYEYCNDKYNFEKYYLSLLISSSFFHSKSDVDEMIEDIIDNVDSKDGIYLIICHEKSVDKNYEFIDAQNLTNIMYFIYTLKKAGFEFLIGYTFINSILFAMLDCEFVSTGWFNNLRKFSKEKFEEIDNMGRRKQRYTSLPLFTYITFENINNVRDAVDINRLLSHCNIDNEVIYNQDAISFVDLEQQYWQSLSLFINILNTNNNLSDKLKFILKELIKAKDLYNEILSHLSDTKEVYNRIKSDSKHLDAWIMAIETFKTRISLIL